jgi:hypothetical protein
MRNSFVAQYTIAGSQISNWVLVLAAFTAILVIMVHQE